MHLEWLLSYTHTHTHKQARERGMVTIIYENELLLKNQGAIAVLIMTMFIPFVT